MQTILPNNTHIFARPSEAETKTKSGILLTDNVAEKPKTAEVINVGSKVTNYKAHDTIIYKPYASTDIKLNSEDFLLIDEEDVLGKVVEVNEGNSNS